jgi:hypothetical protein
VHPVATKSNFEFNNSAWANDNISCSLPAQRTDCEDRGLLGLFLQCHHTKKYVKTANRINVVNITTTGSLIFNATAAESNIVLSRCLCENDLKNSQVDSKIDLNEYISAASLIGFRRNATASLTVRPPRPVARAEATTALRAQAIC